MKHLLLIACLILPLQVSRAADPAPAPTAENAPEANGFSGKVVDTIATPEYTYVQVDTGEKKVWAATPRLAVKVGDQVSVGPGLPMPDYHSKTLNRTFDVVYFTGNVTVGGANAGTNAAPALPPGHPAINGGAPSLPPGHPSLAAQKPAVNLELTGIQRAAGGQTVAEICTDAAKLAGKPVAVRGKVVKYNAAIMGKNWLHIRDGSGSEEKGDNDLTITTAMPAKLGDTVLVTGNVSTNRDFGAGYKYRVILEDAKLTVE
jgi:hypothetical protein